MPFFNSKQSDESKSLFELTLVSLWHLDAVLVYKDVELLYLLEKKCQVVKSLAQFLQVIHDNDELVDTLWFP